VGLDPRVKPRDYIVPDAYANNQGDHRQGADLNGCCEAEEVLIDGSGETQD